MDGGGGGEELYNNHTDVTLQIIRQTMSMVVITAQLLSEDGVSKHHVMHNG